MGSILEFLKLWGQCLIFHYQEETKLLLRKQKVSDTISIIIQTLFLLDSIAFFFLKKKLLYKSQCFVLWFFAGIHLLSPLKSLSHSGCFQTRICKLSTDICPLLAWYLLFDFSAVCPVSACSLFLRRVVASIANWSSRKCHKKWESATEFTQVPPFILMRVKRIVCIIILNFQWKLNTNGFFPSLDSKWIVLYLKFYWFHGTF